MHRMTGTLHYRGDTLYCPLCFKGTCIVSVVEVWRNVGKNCGIVISVVKEATQL